MLLRAGIRTTADLLVINSNLLRVQWTRPQMCSTSPRFHQVFQGSWGGASGNYTSARQGRPHRDEESTDMCAKETPTHTTPPPHTSHSQTLTAHRSQTASTHILHTFHTHPHTHHTSSTHITYIPAHIHTPPTHTAHIHNIHLPHILCTPCTHITHTHNIPPPHTPHTS